MWEMFTAGFFTALVIIFIIACVVGLVCLFKQSKEIKNLEAEIKSVQTNVDTNYVQLDRDLEEKVNDINRIIGNEVTTLNRRIDAEIVNVNSNIDSRVNRLETNLRKEFKEITK